MNDNNAPVTLEDEIRQLYEKYDRYYTRLQIPDVEDMRPVAERDFWEQYCDYAISCVSMALRKAELAMDYIDALQRHPDYSFDYYVHVGDPVGLALECAVKQKNWVSEKLNSQLFFSIRADEDNEDTIAEDRQRFDSLQQALRRPLNTYQAQLVAKLNSSHEPVAPAVDPLPEDEEELVRGHILGIKEEFYHVGMNQVEARVALVSQLIDAHAAGQVFHYPFLDDPLNLSPEYVEKSRLQISNQFAQLRGWQNKQILPDEEGYPRFPEFRILSLDLEL